jgi:hypothetical protein
MRTSGKVYVDALRVTTRPALVAACGRAALAMLVGLALVLSVWKGLPMTASVIASGGLLVCAARHSDRISRRSRLPRQTADGPPQLT